MKYIRILKKNNMKIIAEKVIVTETFWQRFKGLMLKRDLNDIEGLLIEPCSSIHMMFMRFKIDAVFLDAQNKIKKIYENLKPWFGFGFSVDAAKVIEFKAGIISEMSLKVGDTLILQNIS